ncbi:hypothetical protein D2E26_1220 [Bifidobacterium dolichotidis]|uniref:Uncharacterized protein n=1 Tax=Bifidobacterium dolichotidis TaxID=2306976 RepID=A0A430FQS6_9BIFI|nr:hypothetical protein D2E26_1220 [Bifidobacterium dolichotidis]
MHGPARISTIPDSLETAHPAAQISHIATGLDTHSPVRIVRQICS